MSDNIYGTSHHGMHNDVSADIADKDNKSSLTGEFDTSVFVVDFTKGLKKFWYIVLILALVLGLAASYLKYKRYVPMYQSSVSFSVSTVSFGTNGSSVNSSYYDNSSASQLSKTFPYIVNTALMRNALIEELGTNYINGTIAAAPVTENSNIFKLTVTSNSAQDSFDIVNAVIKVYPEVASFVTGNVKLNILIQPTLPSEPYTTNNIVRTAAIAAFIGAAAGFGIIALFAFFKNTIRKKEDFKNKLNQKCLVEIPYVVVHRKSKKYVSDEKTVRITGKNPLFKESFRLLRRRLLKNLSGTEKVIAVTSSAENEGKTTVALNLAHTVAIAGKKTALVDMDLKRGNLKKYLLSELPENDGVTAFTDIYGDDNDFSKAEYKADDNLFVFFGNGKQKKPDDGQFDLFFKYLRENYDYIIVNSSPGASVSDTVAVCNLCDCIIVVARQDFTSIDKIRRTLEFLSYSSAKIKGFVFNGVREGFSGYGGYYYGGKYGYGKYGYGRYGYGRYGYGKHSYGYGRYGYGYGYGHRYGYYGSYGGEYGYGDDEPENESSSHRLFGKNKKHSSEEKDKDIPDTEIPDNNAE